MRVCLLAVATALICSEAALGDVSLPTPPTAAADSSAKSEFEALLEESVVVTASLAAETSATAPGSVWNITGDDLQQFGLMREPQPGYDAQERSPLDRNRIFVSLSYVPR